MGAGTHDAVQASALAYARASGRLPTPLGDRTAHGRGLVVSGSDGGLDRAGHGVDGGGEGVHGLQRTGLAPAGDVGDALALNVEADLAADHVGHGVDQDLRLMTCEVLVVELAGRVCVGDLVDEDPHPGVGRTFAVDHDLALDGIAPALCAAGIQLPCGHPVAERLR